MTKSNVTRGMKSKKFYGRFIVIQQEDAEFSLQYIELKIVDTFTMKPY